MRAQGSIKPEVSSFWFSFYRQPLKISDKEGGN
jgi:hypothetical protein